MLEAVFQSWPTVPLTSEEVVDVLCCYNVPRLQLTGISQSYISQWLLQQGLEMSDSKRRAFYRWYLLERNNPGETHSKLMVRQGMYATGRVYNNAAEGWDYRSLDGWWMFGTRRTNNDSVDPTPEDKLNGKEVCRLDNVGWKVLYETKYYTFSMNLNHCLLTPSICLPLHPTVLHGKPTHLRSRR